MCGAKTQKKEISKNTKKEDAVRRCIKGYDCRFMAKEKLKHIVSKEAFNIDGLGKKLVEQLWDLKLIKAPSDIFKLNYNKIRNFEGWGDLSIDNLKKAIEKSKTINLDRFIYSIGIRHIGQENAKILAAFFISINEFSKLFDEKKRKQILINLVDLDGIGETQVNSIDNFFSNERNTQISKNLIDELKIQNIKPKNTKESFLIKKLCLLVDFKT